MSEHHLCRQLFANAAIAASRVGSCAALRRSPFWPLARITADFPAHARPLGEPGQRHEGDVTAITICLNWMAVVITFTVSSRVMSQCGRARDWIGPFAGRRTRP
jgi:hypothetical protein